MQEVAQSPLAAWENFYIIVGSSAGALTGLQFVVITLVMESRMGANPTTIGAFATPTIVHFWPGSSLRRAALLACSIPCSSSGAQCTRPAIRW